MAFVVIYDANVLYPSTLCDLLIRIAQAGLVQAKWTDQIPDETFDNLKADRPDLDPARPRHCSAPAAPTPSPAVPLGQHLPVKSSRRTNPIRP